jgi:hypothetical protein
LPIFLLEVFLLSQRAKVAIARLHLWIWLSERNSFC